MEARYVPHASGTQDRAKLTWAACSSPPTLVIVIYNKCCYINAPWVRQHARSTAHGSRLLQRRLQLACAAGRDGEQPRH